jgi:hypothetical protein
MRKLTGWLIYLAAQIAIFYAFRAVSSVVEDKLLPDNKRA